MKVEYTEIEDGGIDQKMLRSERRGSKDTIIEKYIMKTEKKRR